jgi:hypothetical protein
MWWILRKLDKCPKELSVTYSQWCADSVKHFKGDAYAYVASAAKSANAAHTAAKSSYAAAFAADFAVDAFASDIAAAADAFADARSKQADYLRSIVPNPFAL